MQNLSFCKFVDRLQMKSNEKQNCKVNSDVNESYTSKTCHQCGILKNEDIFKCKFCNFTIERDFIGSIGITIKCFLI